MRGSWLIQYRSDLKDKSFHTIFEALFSFVLHDKPNYYDKKKSNAARVRLGKCATAVRTAASRGASKLGRKTLFAVVDHITQVLPGGPNNDYVQPLLQDYVKALAEILSRQANVELLARQDGEIWETCVDFFLDIAHYILPAQEEVQFLTPARSSPVPTLIATRSTGSSTPSSQLQKRTGTGAGEGGPLKDVLDGLLYLVTASNAPVQRKFKDITNVVFRVLEMKHLSLGSVQTLGFAIINAIFSATQADDIGHANASTRRLLPLMSYWWRSDKVSQDEGIRALRNEILKSIFLTHLHLEHLALNASDDAISRNLEDLIDNLWTEYSKRGEAFRLQLSDITFTPAKLPSYCPQLPLFGIRPHNPYGESHWAVVQNLAILEHVFQVISNKPAGNGTADAEQPRKRRRMRQNSSRIRLRLKAVDVTMQRTALQVVPFLLTSDSVSRDELSDLLPDLVTLASDKNPVTSSWALIACAR